MSLNTIENVIIDIDAFKHEDTTVDFHINLSNIYKAPVRPDSTHTFTAKVANNSGYIADFPCKIDGSSLVIDSDEFVELPPDNYQMEIWETWTNKDGSKDTAIYPSITDTLRFKVNNNIEDKNGKLIKTIDFKAVVENTVKQYLKDHPGAATGSDIDLSNYYTKDETDRKLVGYAKKSELPTISLDVMKRELSVNGQTVKIPVDVDLSKYALASVVPEVIYDADKHMLAINGQKVELPSNIDLSNYYTKSEVDDKLAQAATGGKVDLTDYLKVADADAKYATKQELPDVSGLAKKTDLNNYAKKSVVPVISLDTEARKLTINGTEISIPASVDLSDYATKQELPKITYDQDTKSLTINGTKVELPSNVDLSGYYTKSEVDDKLAKAATGGKVDLTGYLTKTEASKTYATKAELPDMSNVATKDELPSTEGLAKKTDLDNYALKKDIPAAPDLSGYETKQEASDTFATKAEVPSVDGLAKESDIPKVVLDVAKRTLTVNGQSVDIPGNVDLSHFYTKDEVDKKLTDIASGGKVDLTGYLTKVDADGSYLAKGSITMDTDKRVLTIGGQTIDIPTSVDLSGYLTKADAEEMYAKKADIPEQPDLTQYAKKTDLPSLDGYAKLTDIPSVGGLVKEAELVDYAKKTDLPSLDDYAKKEDVPSIDGLAKESEIPQIKLDTAARTLTLGEATINIPNTVDLSGYATKAELPKVSINSETRTVTINGQSISIPASVDLSGYYTKDEVDTKISQSNPNLTPYLKTADADKKYAEKAALDSYLTQITASATYATKAEIPAVPDMSQYAKKSDIPKAPDLSEYAKSSDVAMVDSKAVAAMDKAVAALAAADKASSGAKIDYDKLYDGFADKIMTMKF